MRKRIINSGGIISLQQGEIPRRKKELNLTGVINHKDVIVEDEKILDIVDRSKPDKSDFLVDAKGMWIMPGIVDAHTHPIFGGQRYNEFYLRAQGKSYLEIAEQGGGILSTVEQTRCSNPEILYEKGVRIINKFLELGTTTIEAKSGYGLSLEDEVKILSVIRDLNKNTKMDIFPTFLGAHSVPREYKSNPQDYVKLLCDRMIPEIASSRLADYLDVFCEKGAFSIEQTEKILNSAKLNKLKIRMHAEQLSHNEIVPVAMKYSPVSLDHGVMVSPQDIQLLAKSSTTVILLPGTEIVLNQTTFAPAREMIEQGCIIALATDFNPGSCPIQSMWLIASFAVLKLNLTIAEILNAITVNAAYSLGIADKVGQIKPGYQADIIFLDIDNPLEIPYWIGANPVKAVMKKGQIVYQRNYG